MLRLIYLYPWNLLKHDGIMEGLCISQTCGRELVTSYYWDKHRWKMRSCILSLTSTSPPLQKRKLSSLTSSPCPHPTTPRMGSIIRWICIPKLTSWFLLYEGAKLGQISFMIALFYIRMKHLLKVDSFFSHLFPCILKQWSLMGPKQMIWWLFLLYPTV